MCNTTFQQSIYKIIYVIIEAKNKVKCDEQGHLTLEIHRKERGWMQLIDVCGTLIK